MIKTLSNTNCSKCGQTQPPHFDSYVGANTAEKCQTTVQSNPSGLSVYDTEKPSTLRDPGGFIGTTPFDICLEKGKVYKWVFKDKSTGKMANVSFDFSENNVKAVSLFNLSDKFSEDWQCVKDVNGDNTGYKFDKNAPSTIKTKDTDMCPLPKEIAKAGFGITSGKIVGLVISGIVLFTLVDKYIESRKM